jgi:subtilase family serine protease
MPVFSPYSALFLWVWVCVCSGNGSNIHGSLTDTHVFREVSPNLVGRSDLARGNRISGVHLHEVVIVIRQRNINQLISLLDESSNQSSLKYGKHLSREEVTTLTSNPSSRDTVVSYLRTYGATVVSETIDGDFLTVSASIAVWEEVFNTKIFAFNHTRKNGYKSMTVRAEEYYVPRELDSHIQGVFNLIDMPSSHCDQMSVQSEKITESFTKLDPVSYHSAAQYMTVYQMEAYYNMSQKKDWCPKISHINHSCLSRLDLEKFQEYFSVKVELLNSTFQSSSNDNWMHCSAVPSSCHEEFGGSEIVIATSQRHPSVFYCSVGITEWLLAIANNPHPPSVLIVDNIAEEKEMPLFVKETFNNLAIKLCAMGVTILVDSGVDGAVGQSDTCEYRPLLYSSSPYITSVGTVPVSLKRTCILISIETHLASSLLSLQLIR